MSSTFTHAARRAWVPSPAASPAARTAGAPSPTSEPDHAGCACGGGCPRCAEAAAVETSAIEGVIQRDFDPVPDHSEEEILAAMGASEEEEIVSDSEDMDSASSMEDMGGMQMKLVVGSKDDPAEVEADAVADAIVSGAPAPPVTSIGSGVLSRSASRDPGVKPPAGLSRYLADPGPGSALPASTRARIEPGLGAEFSHVRLHTDSRAQAAAAGVGARAFALGSHIWLGRNETSEDTRLMAHELTHVVQQGHAGSTSASPQIQRKIITSPKKLVDFIEGPAHKSETRTDPVTSTTGPAHQHLMVHEKWHRVDHRDPKDPLGADIDDPFGELFMEFHHGMMNDFKANGGSVTTWGATTAPPTGMDFGMFTDPAKLASIKTANNFGNIILKPHNGSHQFFSRDDAEDVGMKSTYWAPRHDVFYKLHTWMDDRYIDWKKLKSAKKSP